MKKLFILPLLAFSFLTATNCANQPQIVRLTLISEWGSFSDGYPMPKLTLNVMKSQKFCDVKGVIEPVPFFPEVHSFEGWTFDQQGTKKVPDDYVLNEDTTVYANYSYDSKDDTYTYLVFNVNYNEKDVTSTRHILEFAYKNKISTEPTVSLDTGFKCDRTYFKDDNDYYHTKIAFKFDENGGKRGPCIVKIHSDGNIDDFRLSSLDGSGPYSEGNSYVTAILLSNCIKTVGDYAFDSNYWLMATHLPDGVKTIGQGAFYVCYSLNFIEFPSTLTTIGEKAFFGCATMEHAYFNNGLENINNEAFLGCASLREIHIPDSVKNLGEATFRFCFLNNDLQIGRGIEVIPGYCFAENYYLQKVTIPNNINVLDDACFSHCDSLTDVVFEEGGDVIEDSSNILSTFQLCISLTKVKMSARIKTMGQSTFHSTLLYELDLTSCQEVVDFGIDPFAYNTPIAYKKGSIFVPNHLVSQYQNAKGWSDYKDIIVGK